MPAADRVYISERLISFSLIGSVYLMSLLKPVTFSDSPSAWWLITIIAVCSARLTGALWCKTIPRASHIGKILSINGIEAAAMLGALAFWQYNNIISIFCIVFIIAAVLIARILNFGEFKIADCQTTTLLSDKTVSIIEECNFDLKRVIISEEIEVPARLIHTLEGHYILLSKMVLEVFSEEQIQAIIAHELGHFKQRVIIWDYFFAALSGITEATIVIAALIHIQNQPVGQKITTIGIIFLTVECIMYWALSKWHEISERRADNFAIAIAIAGTSEHLNSAYKKSEPLNFGGKTVT